MKKILIGSPTSNKKDYILNEFMEGILGQDYPNYDIFLVDNSLDNGEYADRLRSYGVGVSRLEWEPDTENVSQMLARARNTIRLKAIEDGYDFLMCVDSDIVIPSDTLSDLSRYNKDIIGYPYNVFGNKGSYYSTPMVLRSGTIIPHGSDRKDRLWSKCRGFDMFTWKEINAVKADIARVYGTGLGCALISREALIKVPFRSHPTVLFGEDVWYWNEAFEKGIGSWIVPKRRVNNNISGWDDKSHIPLSQLIIDLKKKDGVVEINTYIEKQTEDDIKEFKNYFNAKDDIKKVSKLATEIEGWLYETEGIALYLAAMDSKLAIVEIGSWKGLSSSWLGRGSKAGNGVKVYSIDHHVGSPETIRLHGEINTFEEFKSNIRKSKVSDVVVPIVKTSEEAFKEFDKEIDMLFIDGAHDYESCSNDIRMWNSKLVSGGVIAMHDTFNKNHPDVMKVVKEFIIDSDNFENLKREKTMLYATKV